MEKLGEHGSESKGWEEELKAKRDRSPRKRIGNLRKALAEILECANNGYSIGTADAHSFQLGMVAGIASKALEGDEVKL